MIVLSGADLVLPDRVLAPGTLVIDGDRIAEIRPDAPSAGTHSLFAFHGHTIAPGFIDVHVHGVDGVDSLDEGEPIASLAAALPRYGVTAFCPTTVACAPPALRRVLDQVRHARQVPAARSARGAGPVRAGGGPRGPGRARPSGRGGRGGNARSRGGFRGR